MRPQVGGFATRAEAQKALEKVLERLGPGGGAATITLAEFVDEYLEMHQAEPVTIAKLRWLLGKATATLGEKRIGGSLAEGRVRVAARRSRKGIASRRRRRFGRFSTVRSPGGCSTSTRRSGASRIRSGGRRRSGRSSRGSRSRRSPPGSVRSTGRWSCSPPRPGFDRRSCSGSSSTTSTVSSASSTCAARSRTGGSSTRRRG